MPNVSPSKTRLTNRPHSEPDPAPDVPRRPGRPPGVAERHKRRRRTRTVIPAERKFLSINEAADDCGLGRSAIYANLAAIGSLKVGGRRLIVREKLHAWLLSKLSEPAACAARPSKRKDTTPPAPA